MFTGGSYCEISSVLMSYVCSVSTHSYVYWANVLVLSCWAIWCKDRVVPVGGNGVYTTGPALTSVCTFIPYVVACPNCISWRPCAMNEGRPSKYLYMI